MPKKFTQRGFSGTSNARKMDPKGRAKFGKATKPAYKGPKSSRGAQRKSLTRNH